MPILVSMNALAQVRALQVLTSAGLPKPAQLEAASSVTNEVWMTPEVVVRINRKATGRLHREAMLAPALPATSGYPGVVASGGGGNLDWLIVRRRPGAPLAHAWPTMSRAERREAVHQLAARVHHIHTTPTPFGLARLETPQLIDASELFPLSPMEQAIDAARRVPTIPSWLLDDLAARVRWLSSAVTAFPGDRLIHGDLTFENVLWDGRRVTAIIDFEWARGAPADLELDVLLRMCAYPQLHVSPKYADATRAEDYAEIPMWFAEAYPAMFEVDRIADRLELYSLAYDLHDLLQFPPRGDGAQLPKLHAQNRLVATLNGRGHLTRWLAASGR